MFQNPRRQAECEGLDQTDMRLAQLMRQVFHEIIVECVGNGIGRWITRLNICRNNQLLRASHFVAMDADISDDRHSIYMDGACAWPGMHLRNASKHAVGALP